MSLNKSGISIDCAACQCISDNDAGDFVVEVPLSDDKTGLAGIARLHCTVSPDNHRIDMIDWQDTDAQAIETPAALQQRLTKVLGYIGDKKVCGNRNICPADVIRIVKTAENPDL